jgi:hypothetical protein
MKTKLKLCLSLFLFFLLSAALMAQTESLNYPVWPNWVTAAHWEKWDATCKSGYIMGYLHGQMEGMARLNVAIVESKQFEQRGNNA